jgi:hypothetical protein
MAAKSNQSNFSHRKKKKTKLQKRGLGIIAQGAGVVYK